MGFEYLDHYADIGIRVVADSLEGVFNDAACALFNIIYDPRSVSPQKSFVIDAEAPSLEYLVIEFLNEIISFMDREEVFFSQCEKILIVDNGGGKSLRCSLMGEGQNVKKHTVKTEVKAATYSGLVLKQENNKYIFQCLVDV